MARAAVPKLFERNPNLSLVNTSRLSSLLISAIYSFLTYLHYRQTQTSSGNTEYTQLQFGSPRREFFLTTCRPCLGFDPCFENHWTR